MEWDGEPFAADLGHRPRFKESVTAKALVWIKGKDMEGAKTYAKTMQHDAKVFLIESETPLEDARKLIIA